MSNADDDVRYRHFIALATDTFDDSRSFARLEGVSDEVAAFRSWLCDPSLGDRRFTPDCADLADNPSFDAVMHALCRPGQQWTASHAVALYVTGHGFTEGNHWIALKSTYRDLPYRSGLSTESLIGWLTESPVDHLLVLVDVCEAGAALERTIRIPTNTKDTFLLLASAGKQQRAGVGELARAVHDFLHDPLENKKYARNKYFDASEFVAAVGERLHRVGQRFVPLSDRPTVGTNHCLPNPGWEPFRESGRAIRGEDLEAHWSPRARGVASEKDRAWLFTGRQAAMAKVIAAATGRPGALVVTGAAGSGKSALLGRLVTLADSFFVERHAAAVAAEPVDRLPAVGTIDAAVVATGRNAVEILGRICAAVDLRFDSSALPDLETLRAAWWSWLRGTGRPVTVVLDCLDEAANPVDVVRRVLAQLDPPDEPKQVRLLVGVRSPIGSGTSAPGPRPLAEDAVELLSAERLDLDRQPASEGNGIAEYIRGALVSPADSPYRGADDVLIGRVAAAIATRAGNSYLYARLAASSLAGRGLAVDPDDDRWLSFLEDTVSGLVREDVTKAFGAAADRWRAVHLLRAAAFGHGSGLPWQRVWPRVATAIAGDMTIGDEAVEALLNSPLVGYLATDTDDGVTTYRVADAIVRRVLREEWWALLDQPEPGRSADVAGTEAAIAHELVPRRRDSAPAPAYVRRHLVEHAAAAGVLDKETVPAWFLPFVDLDRLRRVDPTGRALPLSPILRRVGHVWSWYQPRRNATALRMWSALYGARLAADAFDDDWEVRWASPAADQSEFVGWQDGITAVTIASMPDGQVSVISAAGRTLKVWDLTGNADSPPDVDGHPGPISAMATSRFPDGRGVVVTISDAEPGLWLVDLSTSPPQSRCLVEHSAPSCALATASLARVGEVAIVGSREGTVTVWNLNAGERVCALPSGHAGAVMAVATVVSGQGHLVVTGGDDGTLAIWDLASGRLLGTMRGHAGAVSALAATTMAGRPIAVTGGEDATVRVWDLTRHAQVGPALLGHSGAVASVVIATSGDGRVCAMTAADDPTVRAWDLERHAAYDESITSYPRPARALCAIDLPPGRPVLITGARDGAVKSWDRREIRGSRTPLAGPGQLSSVAVGSRPDGVSFAVTTSDRDDATLWNLVDGSPTGHRLVGHRMPMCGVATAIRTSGQPIIVSAGWDSSVRLWDPADGKQLVDLREHDGPVLAVATVVTDDGLPIAVTGGKDRTVRLWNLDTAEPVARFAPTTDQVLAVAAMTLPDGRVAAVSAHGDGTVGMWDVSGRVPIGQPLRGHRGSVPGIATALLDGRAVAISAGHDGTVRIWDIARAEQLGRPMAGSSRRLVTVVAGSAPDGRPLAVTGGDDPWIRVWDLQLRASTDELPTPTPVRALALVPDEQASTGLVLAGHDFLAHVDWAAPHAGRRGRRP